MSISDRINLVRRWTWNLAYKWLSYDSCLSLVELVEASHRTLVKHLVVALGIIERRWSTFKIYNVVVGLMDDAGVHTWSTWWDLSRTSMWRTYSSSLIEHGSASVPDVLLPTVWSSRRRYHLRRLRLSEVIMRSTIMRALGARRSVHITISHCYSLVIHAVSVNYLLYSLWIIICGNCGTKSVLFSFLTQTCWLRLLIRSGLADLRVLWEWVKIWLLSWWVATFSHRLLLLIIFLGSASMLRSASAIRGDHCIFFNLFIRLRIAIIQPTSPSILVVVFFAPPISYTLSFSVIGTTWWLLVLLTIISAVFARGSLRTRPSFSSSSSTRPSWDKCDSSRARACRNEMSLLFLLVFFKLLVCSSDCSSWRS